MKRFWLSWYQLLHVYRRRWVFERTLEIQSVDLIQLGGERLPTEPIPMELEGRREGEAILEPDEMGF